MLSVLLGEVGSTNGSEEWQGNIDPSVSTVVLVLENCFILVRAGVVLGVVSGGAPDEHNKGHSWVRSAFGGVKRELCDLVVDYSHKPWTYETHPLVLILLHYGKAHDQVAQDVNERGDELNRARLQGKILRGAAKVLVAWAESWWHGVVGLRSASQSYL